MTLLEVKDLTVSYAQRGSVVQAVRGVDFSLAGGEVLGIAGESGSGKTTMALSLLRLLPPGAKVTGAITFQGEDLRAATWGRLRAVRWAEASVVFQGAMNALNPVRSIGQQIREPIILHDKIGERGARARVAELLDSVGVSARLQGAYPHELSGGQRQRVMIAMALACRPNLIIADEPTTALDVMVQAQILQVLAELVAETNIGVMMISHDLAVLAERCDRLAIMYAGRIVEVGPAADLVGEPKHPYTDALSSAFPQIGDMTSRLAPHGLPGDPPDPSTVGVGCAFAPRCPVVREQCLTADIELWDAGAERSAACIRVLPGYASDTAPTPHPPTLSDVSP